MQYILLAVLAYLGYRFYSWWGVLAVVVAYIVITVVYRMARANADKRAAVQIVGTPLSDAEKAHLSLMKERDQRMAERQASKTKYRP